MQISDIENYLWLFTKEWPLVYEVYDKNGKLSLEIIGKAYIYDDIQSDYKIKLESKEEADKLYKLLKALFIMQTEVSHHYKIRLSINDKGGLDFNINNKKIIYEILSSFVKEEYLKAEDNKNYLIQDKTKKEKELDRLQKKSSKLEQDFLEKEKQITTFLECKKTFFGRVKYFIKYKKVKLVDEVDKKEKEQDVKIIRVNKYADIKDNYTLEELIELYKQVDKEELKVTNLNLDIKAIKQKIKNLEGKVKNAVIYIQEIDKHKKSIFEFWKFTNKDKEAELPAGEVKEKDEEKIKKVFNYEFDFEDLSTKLDEMQRNNLSRDELNSLYLTTTFILDNINQIVRNEAITRDQIVSLKHILLGENSSSEKEKFDIFDGAAYDENTKTLANKKHREAEREITKILDIKKTTTAIGYTKVLEQVIENLDSAFKKIELPLDLSVYKASSKDFKDDKFNVFNIEGKNTIENILKEDVETFNLYKINLKENDLILAFTNIAYFENSNKTLPLGMNVSEGILLNNELLDLELKSKEKLKIVSYNNPNDELSDITIKTINVEEY